MHLVLDPPAGPKLKRAWRVAFGRLQPSAGTISRQKRLETVVGISDLERKHYYCTDSAPPPSHSHSLTSSLPAPLPLPLPLPAPAASHSHPVADSVRYRLPPPIMASIPNMALRGLEVALLLLLRAPPKNQTYNTDANRPGLLRDPRPRPLGPPRRLPSLRRRPFLYKLQRLPRHLAPRHRIHRLSR